MQITSFEQYAGLAVRTAKSLPMKEQITHAKWGLCTEAGELLDLYKRTVVYGKPFDKANLIEEIGDMCWYIALYVHTCEVSFAEPAMPTIPVDTGFEHATLEELCKLSSAGLGLGVMPVGRLLDVIPNFCAMAGVDFWGCLGTNILKLAKRYGDKYTDQAALMRNLEAERGLLESRTS